MNIYYLDNVLWLKLNKLIISMYSRTLYIISCVSLIEFSNTAN